MKRTKYFPGIAYLSPPGLSYDPKHQLEELYEERMDHKYCIKVHRS